MNFTDTYKSVELVLTAGEVPLLVGETGIGKTSLARELAHRHDWSLVGIDGNLLKEGEIGGLPTVENGTTVYAVHHKLRTIDEEIAKGKTVLLFIDEINRCDHAVQQELMNLILNREINGYALSPSVHIIAAMNPSDAYDYEVVEMDAAQENRFVWLYMEPDYLQWLDWASSAGIEEKVMEFISTYPEYLDKTNEDDINATPRSYERISKLYTIYKNDSGSIPKSVFHNVIRGNVGKLIAEEFIQFINSDASPRITYNDVFSGETLAPELSGRVAGESHTRLYLTAKNVLKQLDYHLSQERDNQALLSRFVAFLSLYPVDLRLGVMKDMKAANPKVYACALDNADFIDSYFAAFRSLR